MTKRDLDSIILEESQIFREELLKTLKSKKYTFKDMSDNFKLICDSKYGRFSKLIYNQTINSKTFDYNLILRTGSIINSYNQSKESGNNKINDKEIKDITKKIALYSFLKNDNISIKNVNQILIPYLSNKLKENKIEKKNTKRILYKIYNSRQLEEEHYKLKKNLKILNKKKKLNNIHFSKEELYYFEKSRIEKQNSEKRQEQIENSMGKKTLPKSEIEKTILIQAGAKPIKQAIIEEELNFTNKTIEKILQNINSDRKEKKINNSSNKNNQTPQNIENKIYSTINYYA